MFPHTHLWMLLPFFIAVAGFYFSYWSKLSEVPFHQHLHGITATLWYVSLIVQPWLVKKKMFFTHRKIGFIGLFLAGGVVFSALQIVPNNLSAENFSEVLKYGLTWIDFTVVAGFSLSVILAMINSRKIQLHARYMIASSIWVIIPALTRLIYFPMLIYSEGAPKFSFVEVIHFCALVTCLAVGLMMYLDYRKDAKVYAPYVLVVLGTVFFAVTFHHMYQVSWWVEFCGSISR